MSGCRRQGCVVRHFVCSTCSGADGGGVCFCGTRHPIFVHAKEQATLPFGQGGSAAGPHREGP